MKLGTRIGTDMGRGGARGPDERRRKVYLEHKIGRKARLTACSRGGREIALARVASKTESARSAARGRTSLETANDHRSATHQNSRD